MKRKFSFIEKFQFKYILLFCLILLTIDIAKFARFLFIKQQVSNSSFVWFPIAIGLCLILMAVMTIKYLEEKMALIAFGIAFISNALTKLIGYQTSLTLAILFELIGIYCYWILHNKISRLRK